MGEVQGVRSTGYSSSQTGSSNAVGPDRGIPSTQTEPPSPEVPWQDGFAEGTDPGAAPPWPSSPGADDHTNKSLVLLQFKNNPQPLAGPSKPSPSPLTTKADETKKKIDAYYDRSNTEYTLPDGSKVRALPHFRMNQHGPNGDTGADAEAKLTTELKPKDPALQRAIHMVAYGRGTPEQIKMVTQALIDKGDLAKEKEFWETLGKDGLQANFPNTSWPLSDADAIKLMQFSKGVGVDCAGYVQQEFLAVHGGSRADYGFQSIGDEDLTNLKGNKHFKQVTPAGAQTGDLMILNPPANDTVGHTVMIEDHHVLDSAERANYPGIDAFAKPGDKVHVYVVEASFGAGPKGDPTIGGAQRRTFFYNETTGKWADIRRDWDRPSAPTVHISSTNGPYEHPMNGIFHPKGK